MTVDYQDLQINGVRVETYGTPSVAPPLLFVHGGCQGSWAWEKWRRDLPARAGMRCV
jgi:pimeloyl-ACP methyl ester carboxylesterase